MISATVRVEVNHAKLRTQVGRDARKFVDRVTEALEKRAKELAPDDKGNLRRSIRNEKARMVGPTRANGRVVALSSYAVYQHEGTGLRGPRHRIIRPKRAKALRFFWRKAGGIVFFKYVRGTSAPPSKFLVRAVQDVLSSPPWKIVYFTSVR